MRKCLLIVTAFNVAACASQSDAPIECGRFTELDGTSSHDSMVRYADDIVAQTQEVESELRSNPSVIGFWGSINSRLSGTSATDFAVHMRHLRRRVALQIAREQALVGDGTPLVDPSKEWACKMLADSVASLDLRQSSTQILYNLANVRERFGERYPFRQRHGKASE